VSDGTEGDVEYAWIPSDRESRALMGLFDAPAFARRGADLESSIEMLRSVCDSRREESLPMVRLRLNNWCRLAAANGWIGLFDSPIDSLHFAAFCRPPSYAHTSQSKLKRAAAARDLVASVSRWNARWQRQLLSLNLGPVNQRIEKYNLYYTFEKECCLGSLRAATRNFQPAALITVEQLMLWFPLLPLPTLVYP
jgi:hypothetical protein